MNEGWLAPRGPQDPRTYWIRRGAVIAVGVLIVALLLWAIIAAATGGRSKPAATTATPSPSITLPKASASASGSAASPSASASASADPSASPSATSADATPAPGASAAASATPDASASATPAASAAPTTTQVGILPCDPASLRLTVSGEKTVQSTQDEVLTLGVINGGKTSCILELSQKNYELRVSSGTDQIFTTAHCAAWVGDHTKVLKPEEAFEWRLTWPTRRSEPECKIGTGYLQPGTYVARATLGSATSDKLVIQLVG